MSDFNQQIIDEFRANGGKVGGYFADRNLILLTTTGAKSGIERVAPLVSFEFDGDFLIVASKGGAPTNPDWYHNVLANPAVTVERGTERFQATATPLSEPRRSETFARVAAEIPGFGEYQEKTERVIPVVALSRVTEAG